MRNIIITLTFASSLLLVNAQSSKKQNQIEIPEFKCKVRLPDNINNYRPTIQPVLTPNGNRLYFDRKYHPNNVGSLQDCDDIWYSDRNSNGTWNEPINVGPPLNTRGCDVLFSISPDGNSALVGGLYSTNPNQVKKPGFSITTWNGTSWMDPIPIIIPNYYNNSGYFYASLSADNKVLLFGISRNDVMGDLDLYCSLKDKQGNWMEPITLGPTLNSVGMEVSPFLALDGKTLYFSSNRKGGFGKNDLYVSRRLDDTWQKWSDPKNLGESINTPGDELSISLNAIGDTACIISADSINQLEGIYFVCLPKEVRPQKVNLDKIIKDSKKVELSSSIVYFESNSSKLNESTKEQLQLLSSRIKNTKQSVTITGYADDKGSTIYNKRLSYRRAKSVSIYLRKIGYKHVTVLARGEEDIQGENFTEDQRIKLRKVEIQVK